MIWPDFNLWWLVPVAAALDFYFGDRPLPWPHPARLVGRACDYLETWAGNVGSERMAGLACLVVVAGASGYITRFLCSFPGAGIAVALYLAYAALAFGRLTREGRKALNAIDNGALDEARATLAALSRHNATARNAQDINALRRALADTMAGNFTDAFTAPLFWLCLGGPAGLWVYKAVHIMHSIWSHEPRKRRELGFAAKRLDSALAWIPARLSALFIRLGGISASWTMPGGSWPGFGTIFRQAARMENPNAGCSMAALAWLVGAPMGGPTVCGGELIDKPWLGPSFASGNAPLEWTSSRLLALMDLMKYAALWGLSFIWLVSTAILYFIFGG